DVADGPGRPERRSSPRASVREGVRVEIIGRGCTIALTNVGPGGFAIASDEMLASVSRREFRFSAAHEPWSIVITAQMASRLLPPRRPGKTFGQYVPGFTFCDPAAEDVQGRIREFLERVAG